MTKTARSRSARRLLIAIALAVIVADQVTKALAVRDLTGRGMVTVLGGALRLQLYRNFAGSGNRLTGHPVLVSLFAVVAVAVIAAGAWRWVRDAIGAIAVGLLLGGGVSNLSDRLLRAPGPLRGGVVDWIKPTATSGSMNLADVAIAAGVILVIAALLLDAWRTRRARHLPDRPDPGPAPIGPYTPGP